MDLIPTPTIPTTIQTPCSVCHQPILLEAYFCPNCGNPLKPKPPSTTWWTQLGIYALSLFLPPLGLWPAVKYLRSSDEIAKRVGWIAVALTVISIVIAIWLTEALIQNLQSQLDSASLMGF
jgi:amino acid transporter